jgi:DNA (cytosine-5)-methyltransferase 1
VACETALVVAQVEAAPGPPESRGAHREELAMTDLTCVELCTGGGGQALGLERAGFTPVLLAEIDPDCCDTLIANRPGWPVLQDDITRLAAGAARDLAYAYPADLVAGGLPCQPHSRGGRQLGEADERHLWDAALRIIGEVRPRAVILETSNAILAPRFALERARTLTMLHSLGYREGWEVIDCSHYGVSQQRKRAVLVAFSEAPAFRHFTWPEPSPRPPVSVGTRLLSLAGANGWAGAALWAVRARGIAPTVVGGSTKHGGADLGASQGKAAWRKLGIDPMGIADGPPGPDGKYPRGKGLTGDAGETGLMLTTEMAARLQGFPPDWVFRGGKTARYRQVGNAFPPPAAARIGLAVRAALTAERTRTGDSS